MRNSTWRAAMLLLASVLALSTPPSIARADEVGTCYFCYYHPNQVCNEFEIIRLCSQWCGTENGWCSLEPVPQCGEGLLFICG